MEKINHGKMNKSKCQRRALFKQIIVLLLDDHS